MKFVANLVLSKSKTVLFGFIALIALSTVFGFQSFGKLTAGGYDDPGSDSTRVSHILKTQFKQSQPELVGILDFPSVASDPRNTAVGTAFLAELQAVKGVKSVTSYFNIGDPMAAPSMLSKDKRAVYYFIDLDDNIKQSELVQKIESKYNGDFQSTQVYFAGMVAVTNEINQSSSQDIAGAEEIAIPLVIILLLFVFGSLVAAGLPLLVGGLGIVGSFFFIWISTLFNDTSIFAVNMVTGMGLGLGIDYSLLMVSRYREELEKGTSVVESVRATILSAGRTVLFSGFTVAVVCGALFFFPQGFLRSMAIGAVSVVLVCVVGALFALPAVLKLLGKRINSIRVVKNTKVNNDDGAWSDIARAVMAKPLTVSLVSLGLLGFMASLLIGAKFGQVDDRILPKDNKVVVASDIIRDRFSGREASPIEILLKDATPAQIADYATKLSADSRIAYVRTEVGMYPKSLYMAAYWSPTLDKTVYEKNGWHRIIAIHKVEPRSPEGQQLTDDIRNLAHPGVSQVLVGGSAAVYTDSQEAIQRNLPLALIWIVITTIVLLFLFTGSILLPIKAVILNFLSLGATIGVLVWVFGGGNLQFIVGNFQVTGIVDTSTLVLISVLVFGLSMDYELFLLSRIKEQHEAGFGTTDSVAYGLQKSGRIITAAALVLAVSFMAFVTSGVSMIKMLGFGIAFAILLDATIVRALLVPALMRLFGQANWWAPKWAKKIADKVGLAH